MIDVAAQVDAGVALGERRIVDADVGVGGAADQSRPFEGEAAAVVAPTDPAQHDARIGLGVDRRIASCGGIAARTGRDSTISTPST